MRIAIIASVCTSHDAVSSAVRNNIDALVNYGDEVTLFALRCDFEDIKFVEYSDPVSLSENPDFYTADLIVAHFAIFNPLFPAILLAHPRQRVVIVFHNITPRELVAAKDRKSIDESFRQLSLFRFADHVICDSKVNQSVLYEGGVSTPSTVQGLGIELPPKPPDEKPSFYDDRIRLLFLGRFVKSKGPGELLEALKNVILDQPGRALELALVGNTTFSDNALIEEIQATITELTDSFAEADIRIEGNAPELRKQQLLHNADLFVLPTYHEGFCLPVIEALAAGCRVITYDNSNLPHISGGLSRLVPTGDIDLLSQAIAEVAAETRTTLWRTSQYRIYSEAARNYAETYDVSRTKAEFVTLAHRLTKGTAISR